MKKILNILLIFFIAFLVNINVKATEMSTMYSTPTYTLGQQQYIQNFKSSEKYSQIIDYVRNNMTNYFVPSKQQYYDFTDNYMMIFYTDTTITDSVRVSFMKNFEYIPYNVYYTINDDYGYFSIFLNAVGGLGAYFDFNFTNNVLTSVNLYSTGNESIRFINILDEVGSGENLISYPDNKFIDTTFFESTSQTVSFGYDEGRFTVNVPIKLGDNVYTPPTSFSGQDFLNQLQQSTSNEPNLLEPTITQKNGYSEVIFEAENYTQDTINEYNIVVTNITNASNQYMQPTLDNYTNAKMTLNVYENTTFHYYLFAIDNPDVIIQEYYINVDISYTNKEYFSIKINNIDNQNNTINYSYIPSEYNTLDEYKCYHRIDNGNNIEDSNCNTIDNQYTLNVGGNKSVIFYVYDNTNTLVYKHIENFVFDLSSPYITFNENYINNFVNLDVRVHWYNDNLNVKYNIDNGTLFDAILNDLSSYDNSKTFQINNLNQGQIVNVLVYDSNNNIISSAEYTINLQRNPNYNTTPQNMSNFFDSLNINNLASDLVEYTKQIGNILINSKIGNLLLLEFIIQAISLILILIRR